MSIDVPDLLKPIDEQPSQGTTPKPTPLADAARAFAGGERQDFIHSLQTVAHINPDEYGQATQTERLSGIPAATLYQHRERMAELQKGNRYAAIYDQARKTANALRDGNLAAISQDDLDTLKLIEGAAADTRFNEQSTGEKLIGAVQQQWLSINRGRDVANTGNLVRLAQQFDAIDAEVASAEAEGREPYAEGSVPGGFARDYLLASPEQRQVMRDNLTKRQGQLVEGVISTSKELAELPVEPGARRAQALQDAGDSSFNATLEAITEEPGFAFRSAFGATAASAPTLLAGVFGGLPLATTVNFATEYDVKLTDVLQEAGVDLQNPRSLLEALQNDALMDEARTKASRKAAGTTAVDTAGMFLASKLLAPKSFAGRSLSDRQRELANLAVQFPVQGASEGAGEAAGQLLAEGEVDAGEVLLETVAGSTGSTFDVLAFGGGRTFDVLTSGLKQARQARIGQQSLTAAADAAVASKTRGRDADSFRTIAEAQLKDSPLETVWIPAEALQRLNQSAAIDLPALFDKVPGLAEQFADAAARGGSISMKGADYLAYLADVNEQLAGSVRLTADGMSTEDAKAWTDAQEEQITQLREQFSKAPDPLAEARRDTIGELLAAGFRRQDAEQYAAVHLSVLSNLAERTGQAIDQLRQQFPLDIRSQAPEQLRAIPVDDARLAIQRLRAGDIPESGDIFGKSLGEYLRDAGGVNDEGGELAALDIDVNRVGRNRITRREGGLSLDQAAMDAWERGYFPGVPREQVGPQLIVDALRDEVAGSPRFSTEQENATLRDQAETLRQLGDFFGRLDVDLNQLSDDEALAILRNPEQVQGQTLNQSDLERALSMSEDEYIKAVNPEGKTSEEGDVVTVHVGDLDRPRDSKKLGMFKDSNGDDVILYRDSNSSLYAEQDGEIIGQIENRDGETLNIVAVEAQGKGIGTLLATELIRRDPFAQAGSFSPAGERTRRSAFRRLKAEQEQRLNQGGEDDQARGFITFSPRGQQDRRFAITLGEKRDLSTLLHELGHFYLEVIQDLAQAENAPQQLQDDIATIRAWVGAEGDTPLTTEQHEQFARGFESYLAEGKAPSPELAGAFARFKRWLIGIYKDLRRLNVELNDDVRRVFDRLVASDEQIQAAEQVSAAIPLFKDAAAAGMTEQEFAAYQNSIDLAHADARDAVEEEIAREEERRRSAFWREESAKIREEVTEEVDTLPEYQALRALRSGQAPDGSVGTLKLNSGELAERYGTPVVRKLAFTHSRNGQPLDLVASVLGFESGDAMVKAMMGAQPRNAVIQQETERRMEERHGPKQSGEVAERALAAVHNERRADVLAKELRRLAQVGNRRNVTSQQILKEAARRVMSERKVRDIQPAEFQRAEAKASRATYEAFIKGDLDAAYEAKQQQLLNFYLYREAVKARAEVDAIVERVSKYNRSSVRARIGKVRGGYLDQIDAVMEQYEFRNVSLRQLDERKSFGEWYNDQVAAGGDPYMPEFILENMGRTNYKELSLAQLQELDEFLAHVNHLASTKGKLLANKRVKDQKEAEALLIQALVDNVNLQSPRALNDTSRSLPDAMADWLKEANSSLMKLEQVIEHADGGDPNGPWSSIWFQPLAEAQHRRDDLNRQVTQDILTATEEWFAAAGARAGQKVYIKGLGQSLDYNGILAAALNSGNASNLKKLLDGNKWSEATHAEILGHMQEADWRYVSRLWEIVNSLWPDIVALEKQVNGIAPDKVEGVPVETPFGVVQGGYWPLVYDFMSPEYGRVLNNLGGLAPLNEQGGARAGTPKGHTKTRVDSFVAPIVLDVGIISNHISGVIHDLTHRVAIADARKLVTSPTVRQVMNERLGPFQAQQFVNVLDGIANDLAPGSAKGVGVFRRTMSALRSNAAVAWMGYSVSTMFNQVGGYSQALDYFAQKGQRKDYLRALAKFALNPVESRRSVLAMSGEMRNRSINLDPALRDAVKQVVRVGEGRIGSALNSIKNGHDAIRRFAFVPMQAIQGLVDTPVWMGAYEAEGGVNNHDAAVQAADRAVRLTQMAGGAKDLAPIQQNELAKFFLLVYGYASLLWNRNVDIARSAGQAVKARNVAGIAVALERFVYLNLIPAVLAGAIKGALPDGGEDDEDKLGDTWPEYLAIQTILSMTNGVPLARDIAQGYFSDFGYGGISPLGGGLDAAIRATNSSRSEAIATNLTTATGMLFGLPSSALNRPIRTWYALEEGELDDDATTIIRSILLGPPPKKD